MDKLLVIITGPERNGTTYLSQLVYSIPNIYSAFETGLLLDNSFKNCKPFCQWIYHGGLQWGMPKQVDLYSSNLSFDDKYKLLFKYKGSYKNNHSQKLISESKFIVDKTPAYFRNLEFVRNNSKDIPIIITIKYLKDTYISNCVKRSQSLTIFKKNAILQLKTLRWIKMKKPCNIHVYRYEDIIKPSFVLELKKILSYKLDLKNVNISHEKYVKKTNGTYVYKNWSYKEFKVELPDNLKHIEGEYNSLIDSVITKVQ